MPEGIIVKGIGGFYYISTENGIFECKARGVFRKNNLTPMPGDKVKITIVDNLNKKGSIDEILSRNNQFVRPLVANVDQVAIIASVKSPKPDYLLLDKILITSEHKEVSSFIVLNKIDLYDDAVTLEAIDEYKNAGYEVFTVSAKEGKGIEKLCERMKNKVTMMAGQSGVGKSTILNAIMKKKVMETGDISEKIERGKHTTRHAELIPLINGGYIVDTPGFSSFEICDINYTELSMYYPEVVRNSDCKFNGCSHTHEPGCKVRDMVASNEISEARYNRYCYFYDVLIKNDKSKYSGKVSQKNRN